MINMRIGLVGPLPPPSGGMANQTRQLGELLSGEGAIVEVVQTNAAYTPSWVTHVRGLRAAFRLVPFLLRLWKCAGRVDLFHVMANSGWAWHLCAAPAIWIARLRRVPTVVNYRGGAADEFLHKSAVLVRATMRVADSLIVPSGFLVDVFARHGVSAEIVPNVVDLQRFVPDAAPRTVTSSNPHIVVTRNLEAIYDIDTALRAFQRILEQYPGARLTVAGSGPERGPLEAMAGSLGIAERVRFTGHLDNNDIAALYREADVFVNPSRVDNTPISILEALASEVPVVSTNAGGIPYLVRHRETALLVPVADSAAMASAIFEVLKNPAMTKILTTAGRALARQYSWSAVRPLLLDSYRRIIAGAAATRAAHAE